MSNSLKEPIKRFDRQKNVSEAKFSYIKDTLDTLRKQIEELSEESTEFYSFVAESLTDFDKRLTSVENKTKNL